MEKTEIVVIGAGVIGLAVARRLAQQGHEVLIIEAEKRIGSVTSARNSGVIHAGIYYAPDSLKARCCVAGRAALYRYVEERNIPYKKCGKIIVATRAEQLGVLQDVKRRAEGNGVEDIAVLSAAGVREHEPEVTAVGGLYSPSTGIIDTHELMYSLLADAESGGAVLALNSPVDNIAIKDDGFVINVAGETSAQLSCRYLVNASGLAAQKIAKKMTGLNPATIPAQVLAKGNYFSLAGKQPFKMLVYPVPEAGGLGIHATLDMAGRVRFGPDVEWVSDVDYSVDPSRAAHFYQAIRSYWPKIEDGALQPDYAGLRPKIEAQGAADFIVQGEKDHGIAGLVNFYGIESPGLTSALALADHASAVLFGKV